MAPLYAPWQRKSAGHERWAGMLDGLTRRSGEAGRRGGAHGLAIRKESASSNCAPWSWRAAVAARGSKPMSTSLATCASIWAPGGACEGRYPQAPIRRCWASGTSAVLGLLGLLVVVWLWVHVLGGAAARQHQVSRVSSQRVRRLRVSQEFAAAADSAVSLVVSDPNRLCAVFSLAGHRPQSGDGVIAEVALPRWRYVAGRGLHGRPSVRYRTCRLGAPDAVLRTARAGAPS
jgi:hypothetical protein